MSDDETEYDYDRYRIEFQSDGHGVGKFVITTPGVRVELEYTDVRELTKTIYNLDAIIFDAARAYSRGEVTHLPIPEWDPKIPDDLE